MNGWTRTALEILASGQYEWGNPPIPWDKADAERRAPYYSRAKKALADCKRAGMAFHTITWVCGSVGIRKEVFVKEIDLTPDDAAELPIDKILHHVYYEGRRNADNPSGLFVSFKEEIGDILKIARGTVPPTDA